MNKLNEYYRQVVYKIAHVLARAYIFICQYEKDSDDHIIAIHRAFSIIDLIVTSFIYLFIAYCWNVFFITLPIYIAFVASKSFSGGFHFRNHVLCTIVSFGIFVGGAFLVRFIPDTSSMLWIRLVLWIICMMLFTLFAPMDNCVRTIYQHEIKPQKLKSLAVVSVLGLAMLVLSYVGYPTTANALLFGLLAQTICILPCISKSNIVSASK